MYYKTKDIMDFFSILNRNDICYLLIKNINNELPSRLKEGKDIDLLIHPDCDTKFKSLMKSNGFYIVPHPKGKECGWGVLYGVQYPYKVESVDSGLQIDCCNELCTKSISSNVWIPLDNYIVKDIWKKKKWDTELNLWKMDDDTLIVYLIVRAVFEKKMFTQDYIDSIELLLNRLDNDFVICSLNKVFFKFSPILIRMIKLKLYSEIYNEYCKFDSY